MADWEIITPKVNESAEFLEIASDFGNPMELFREALHNAYDWEATEFWIKISVEPICGQDKLVIELSDNGLGMSKDAIIHHFWNLGNSKSRSNQKAIGEKGHGTKIYLRSDRVLIRTSDGSGSYESECEGAFSCLNDGKVHSPRVRESGEQYPNGTFIRIEGYNNNQRANLKQSIVKDYLYWHTVLGSVENQFPGRSLRDFTVYLQALDQEEPEKLLSGHPFAKENRDINRLFEIHGEEAVDHYVKKYIYPSQTLETMPEIKFDVVIYFEGDAAKRAYVELKYQFGATEFNHSFRNIRRIVCWELSPKVKDGSILRTSVEEKTRILHIKPNPAGGMSTYYLDSDDAPIKIQVVCLKEYVTKKLGLSILDPRS